MTYFEPILPALLLLLTFASYARVSRAAKLLRAGSLLALWIVSVPVVPNYFLGKIEQSLEHTTLECDAHQDSPQAIVVLASGVNPPAPGRSDATLAPDTRERCVFTAWLFSHGWRLPVVATGGGGATVPEASYAGAMKRALVQESIPPELITVEPLSRSTYQNALLTTRILKARSIHSVVLVTSAYHMPRAVAVFEKQAIHVLPAPCDFRVTARAGWTDLLPSWTAISTSELLLHEWVGFEVYRWKGWI